MAKRKTQKPTAIETVNQPPHTVATRMEPISWQVSRVLGAAEERILGEHSINLIHQLQRLSIHADWHVVQ